MNLTEAYANFSPQIALIVFIAYVIVDGMYAYYTFQVTKRKPFSAATTGALMHFILGIGVISYVENYLYLIPLAVGSWIGSFLVVRKEEKLKNNSEVL